MRVLMLGWEFPPHISGGLGTACFHLTRALIKTGTEVLFVMPRFKAGVKASTRQGFTLRDASGVKISSWKRAESIRHATKTLMEKNLTVFSVDSPLHPYMTKESYEEFLKSHKEHHLHEFSKSWSETADTSVLELQGGYGQDLMAEVFRYSQAIAAIALEEEFDVIHAHDWMTYPAAILAKQLTGKPMIAHIHALECDRSGDSMNHSVSHLEWAGLTAADLIVAVSRYTKARAIKLYSLPEDKIEVVHNAVDRIHAPAQYHVPELCTDEKRVLFMGRVTFQKGPDYFVEAARLVLDRIPNVRFIMAGSGDMLTSMVRRVAQLRMGERFHFTGFLRGEDVDRMYAMSDLYVMPSVSEPFGISPLEAMLFDVPVIITHQSGVSEVLRRALRVDFWDVKELANKICAILSYPVLAAEVVKNSREELKHIKWDKAARTLNTLYSRLTTRE